jgi:hypothetical protein
VAFAGFITNTQPQHAKTTVKRPGSSAKRATIILPDFKLIRSFRFDS